MDAVSNKLSREDNRNVVRFRVGDWVIYSELSCIRSVNGEVVELELIAIELLNYMVSKSGEVVSIDELMENVWSGRIVTHGTVRRIISILRKAFGDDPRSPTYLRNIPKRGYVLIADVSQVEVAAAPKVTRFWHSTNNQESGASAEDRKSKAFRNNASSLNCEADDDRQAPMLTDSYCAAFYHSDDVNLAGRVDGESELGARLQKRGLSGLPGLWWCCLSLSLACVLGFTLYPGWFGVLNDSGHTWKTELLTSLRGAELFPDQFGDFTVFSHQPLGAKHLHLYVREGERIYSLTSGSYHDTWPVFTQNGKQLAFVRATETGSDVMLADFSPAGLKNVTSIYASKHKLGRLQWNHNGRVLYFSMADKDNVYSVYSLYMQEKSVTRLTLPPKTGTGDYLFAVNPQDNYLALLRSAGRATSLQVLRLKDMSQLASVHFSSVIKAVGWYQEKVMLVEGNSAKLFDPFSKDAEIKSLYHSERAITLGSVSRGQIFLSTSDANDVAIKQVSNPFNASNSNTEQLIISSPSRDFFGEYSKVSNRIYFLSQRSGHRQLWSYSGQSGYRQLTDLPTDIHIDELATAWHDEWVAAIAGQRLILINGRSGDSHILTDDTEVAARPFWSKDGKYIYFIKKGVQEKTLWRARLLDKQAEPLATNVAAAQFLNEQQLLAQNHNGYFTIDLKNRVQTQLDYPLPVLRRNTHWQVVAGIIYVSQRQGGDFSLVMYNPESGHRQEENFGYFGHFAYFSVHQGRNAILITSFYEPESDIVRLVGDG